MWVFVDEAGDAGFKFDQGSTRYFTVTAIVFKTRDHAVSCSGDIRRLREDWGWREDAEFKFNTMNSRRRVAFLEAVASADFTFHAFTLDKTGLWHNALRDKHSVYTRVVAWVFDNALHELENARVVFDRYGNRDLYQSIAAQIEWVQNQRKRPGCVQSIVAEDSHKTNLLQVADVVCGAVLRYHSGKKDAATYLPIIKKRQGTLRLWPS
ncbi:MAG: DUF3800 domain-containing protein [Phycisphaerales bacterium]